MDTKEEIHDAIQWCIDKLVAMDKKIDMLLEGSKTAARVRERERWDGKLKAHEI